MIDLKQAGAGVTAVAGVVGWVYHEFVPQREFDQFVAQDRTRAVLDLMQVLGATPREDVTQPTLCKALQEEIARICTDSPTHPFCIDRAMLMQKAGCQ